MAWSGLLMKINFVRVNLNGIGIMSSFLFISTEKYPAEAEKIPE